MSISAIMITAALIGLAITIVYDRRHPKPPAEPKPEYRGYKSSIWKHITGKATCELCNSPSHAAGDCWYPSHMHEFGLFEGMLHADPELEDLYRREHDIMGTDPPELTERIKPIREWAHTEAQRRRANP